MATYFNTQPQNRYVDFLIQPVYSEYINIDVDNLFEFYLYYFPRIVSGTNITPRKAIRPDGGFVVVPPDTIFTYGNSIANFQLISVPEISRLISSPGKQYDLINIDYDPPNRPSTGDESYEFTYVTLQQAVSVTKRIVGLTETPLVNNSSLTIALNDIIKLSKADNRGDEVTSSWQILKSNASGTIVNQTAVVGVDYNFISGNLTSDIIEVQFLTNNNFTIINNCSGYTISNNIYYNVPSDTSTNSNSISHNFIMNTPTFFFEVKPPLATPNLTIDLDSVITSTPDLKFYLNASILCDFVLDIPSGYFHKKYTASSVVDIITKTDSEWRTEISNRYNVLLEASDFITGEVIFSKSGLPPYTILLPEVRKYNLQFKFIPK